MVICDGSRQTWPVDLSGQSALFNVIFYITYIMRAGQKKSGMEIFEMFINRKVGACTSDKGRPQTKHQTQEQ